VTHPDNSTWTWTKPDEWVSNIVKNNQILRMHGPISPQASNRAKDDSRTAAEIEKQASTCRAILDILLEKCSQGKVGWNTCHISDGTTSSHPEWFPSLFDANFETKPAYYAGQAALEQGEPMSGTPTATPAPTPTPTPSPGTGELYVEYRCATTEASSKRVNPHLIVYNISISSIPLTELTLRYRYTSEVGSNEVCELDYVVIGHENITIQFLKAGSDHCIEIGFTSGAGDLSSSSDTGPIKMRNHYADWQYYYHSDDYSFDPSITDFTQYERVTL
jgi:hypothetical protein